MRVAASRAQTRIPTHSLTRSPGTPFAWRTETRPCLNACNPAGSILSARKIFTQLPANVSLGERCTDATSETLGHLCGLASRNFGCCAPCVPRSDCSTRANHPKIEHYECYIGSLPPPVAISGGRLWILLMILSGTVGAAFSARWWAADTSPDSPAQKGRSPRDR